MSGLNLEYAIRKGEELIAALAARDERLKASFRAMPNHLLVRALDDVGRAGDDLKDGVGQVVDPSDEECALSIVMCGMLLLGQRLVAEIVERSKNGGASPSELN